MNERDSMRDKRVAWLVGHAPLRAFEVPLIRSFGLEVYTPKQWPRNGDFFSATADLSQGQTMTVPPDVLARLDEHDFFEDEFSPDVTEHLNNYFGTVITAVFPTPVQELVFKYSGRILTRAFGRETPNTYSELFRHFGGRRLVDKIWDVADRFWFAPCYDSIPTAEEPFLRHRTVVLPIGLSQFDMSAASTWDGRDARVLFVCPRVAPSLNHNGSIYQEFKKHLGGLPHVIPGRLPDTVDDESAIGRVDPSVYDDLFSHLRCMFYHGREPRRLHYHPLKAIARGMPVVYLRGGLLDEFGGPSQPGACSSYREARKKLSRLLDNDRSLAQSILDAQPHILERFTWDYNRRTWEERFVGKVLGSPPSKTGAISSPAVRPRCPLRIGVFLPAPYRGGSLRWFKHVAMMLKRGASERGIPVDVALSVLEGSYDTDTEFSDVKAMGISVRGTTWRKVSQQEATRSLQIMGSKPSLRHESYVVPSDGCNDFLDCDYWLFVSDRVFQPLLALRPYGALVADYLQRYVTSAFAEEFYELQAESLISLMREAQFVVTTTPAATLNANNYAGIPLRKIHQFPAFIEHVSSSRVKISTPQKYFVWSTNSTPHKNHKRTLKALQKYYEDFEGSMKAIVVGPLTELIDPTVDDERTTQLPYVNEVRNMISSRSSLRDNVINLGELPQARFISTLERARFVLVPNLYDNGCYTVVDAAFLGVPALVADYPAQRYLDETFRLNSTFFNPYDSDELAKMLKVMESDHRTVHLPPKEFLDGFTWERLAGRFFDLVYAYASQGASHAFR